MFLEKLTRYVLFSLLLLAVLLTAASPTFAQFDGSEIPESDSLWLMPAGGTLNFKSYPLTLQAPPNVVKEPLLVTVVPVRPPVDMGIFSSFRLTAENSEGKPVPVLRKAVSLEVQLDKHELLAPTKELVLYKYDERLEQWEALPSEMDWNEMIIQSKERHLGLFGVGAAESDFMNGVAAQPKAAARWVVE